MAIRWRKDGSIVCARMYKAEEGDTYIDDRLTYELTVVQRVIVPDPGCKTNGFWYWVDEND